MTERFVEAPDGWHKNPDCDLHGAVDMITAPAADDPAQDVHCIDVRLLQGHKLYSVALDAGIGSEGHRELTVRRCSVQTAVELFADLVADDVEGESSMSDDLLYFCPNCSVITLEDVGVCPACGNGDDRLTLALEAPEP